MNNTAFLILVLCVSGYRFETITHQNKIKVKEDEKNNLHGEVQAIMSNTQNDNLKSIGEDQIINVDDIGQRESSTHEQKTIPSSNEEKMQVKDSNRKHILMFHPWGTKSHRGQLNALLLGLLERGHKVTGVFPNKSDIKKEGFTEIVVKDGMAALIKSVSEMMMKEDGTSIFTEWKHKSKRLSFYDEMFDQLLLDYKTVSNFIEERNLTVDALIVTAMFQYNGWHLQRKYNCPLILINPMGPLPHISKFFGNIENPSYQPVMELGLVEPMGFKERLINTLYYVYGGLRLAYADYLLPGLKTKLGISISEMTEMSENFSLLLLCSHFVTHNSQPYMANTVEIGGIHCQDGQPLPQDLQQFMDNSPEGVVYVSFGSAVKPTQMTPEKKETFLETFRQLKTPVIWKWNEDNITDLPPNVKLSKWLPQQDLLAHPNLKVFVTHGGLLSVQEALYHQTALVGIPLGVDQKPNLLRAQQKGYAIMLDWTTLDTSTFLNAIKTALTDEEMKSNMKKMHDLFTDQKETPVERAVWWVEYVIRNKGAQFLKPASLSLSWYQLYLLDVIGLILLVLFVILFISVKCCICCKNICCGSRNKYKEE